MRVLHLYHDFWPARGGIEDYLAALTRAQARDGDEPIILCASGDTRTRHEHVQGLRVIRAASLARWYTPFCPSWPLWLRRAQPVLTHLHLPCPLGEWAVWLARPRHLIVSLHNDYVRPQLPLKFHRVIHRAVLRRADAIIVAAPDYARTSPVLRDLQARVQVVPYGIDLQQYTCDPRTPPQARVLFVGRLCYYKGVEVLLDAAPRVHGRVTIVGDGPWRTRLHAQAARQQLQTRVSFRGALSERAMIAQMRAHRVFVFPSTERSEAFGIAQLKAMACGLPVVSSDLPGVSWLNRHGETGLTVPARAPAPLAAAVNQLLADDGLHARLSAGARARAAQFDLPTMVRATRRVYAGTA